jgi:hypothetical protein
MPSSRRPVLSSTPFSSRFSPVSVFVRASVLVVVEQRSHLEPELRVGALEPDVDLAATGKADLERVVVADAVMDQVGRAPPANTCCARSATSDSTQPPETEPA